MKRFIPLIAFFFISSFSFAQYENIDLSKYKLPDIKRHQLDFDLKSNSSVSNSTSYSDDELNEKRESDASRFFGEGDFAYSFYRNSTKFQTTATAHSFMNYSKTKESYYYSSDEEDSNFRTRLFATYDFKYFIGEKQWFLTAIPYSYYSYQKHS